MRFCSWLCLALNFYIWDFTWRTWVHKLAVGMIFQKKILYTKIFFVSEILKLVTYFFTKIFLEMRSWLYIPSMVALFVKKGCFLRKKNLSLSKIEIFFALNVFFFLNHKVFWMSRKHDYLSVAARLWKREGNLISN